MEPRTAGPVAHRMIVVAGLGEDSGLEAFRHVARWAVLHGVRPVGVDLGDSDGSLRNDDRGLSPRVPVATFPGGYRTLRGEDPEIVGSVLASLRDLERRSDLVLLRVPADDRVSILRAAALCGGVVVPVDDTERGLRDALLLSREIADAFEGVRLWPLARGVGGLVRYRSVARVYLGDEPKAFDAQDPAVFSGLPAPPAGGYLAALLAPETVAPDGELFRVGFLDVA